MKLIYAALCENSVLSSFFFYLTTLVKHWHVRQKKKMKLIYAALCENSVHHRMTKVIIDNQVFYLFNNTSKALALQKKCKTKYSIILNFLLVLATLKREQEHTTMK